ncbi:MAG: Ig-like domain-containing protein [Oscillospiraceae bacterium]|nr:Ig-like domain-containing protein [Oscillospiraceae bacterium]
MKKKILSVVLVVAVAVSLFVVPVSASKWEGYIKISTPLELSQIIGSSKYYLTRDIDLKGFGLWSPISSFSGELDGNGFAIRNLTSIEGGLFHRLSGKVRNLGLINVDITSPNDAGALAKIYNGNLVVENCYVTGKVLSTDINSVAAGLVSRIEGGYDISASITFNNCLNMATVTTTSGPGGILGSNASWYMSVSGEVVNVGDSSSITNSINAGTIIGGKTHTGGIAGYFVGGRINNCYNYGTVKITNSQTVHTPGGILGETSAATYNRGSVITSIINSATTGRTAIGYPSENTHTEQLRANVPIGDFKKQETYRGLDFNRVWYIHPQVNNGYPILRTMMKLYKIPTENNRAAPAATSFEIEISLRTGDTLNLGAALIPTGSSGTATYSSNKTSIASVTNNGRVTARAKGTAVITVTVGTSSKRVSVRVT